MRFMEGGRSKKTAQKPATADPFADTWRRVDAAVSAIVDRTTLAELVRDWREKHTKYVPNWEI